MLIFGFFDDLCCLAAWFVFTVVVWVFVCCLLITQIGLVWFMLFGFAFGCGLLPLVTIWFWFVFGLVCVFVVYCLNTLFGCYGLVWIWCDCGLFVVIYACGLYLLSLCLVAAAWFGFGVIVYLVWQLGLVWCVVLAGLLLRC